MPEGQKRDKKYVPRVSGAQTRDKIDFCTLLTLIVKLTYIIVIQRVNRWFELKVIDLY